MRSGKSAGEKEGGWIGRHGDGDIGTRLFSYHVFVRAGRHQVQQTIRAKGFTPQYDGEFPSHLARDSQCLEVALYTAQAGQPGELLGTAKVKVQKIDFAPGSELLAELLGEDWKPTGATVRLFLCRTNLQKTHRTLRSEALDKDKRNRPAELETEAAAAKAELQVAREYIARLEPELRELREKEEAELSQWEAENMRLKLTLSEANKATASLREEMDPLETMLKAALQDKDLLQQEQLKAQDVIRKAESDLQDASAQKETLQRDVTRSLAEIDRMREDLDKVTPSSLVCFVPSLPCPCPMRDK